MINIGNDWDKILKDVFESELYKKIREFLKVEYGSRQIYPDMHDIFNAFKLTPCEKIKVVILGQDPYHGKGQAHGLAFSVPNGIEKPPSLINIFKCLNADLGLPNPAHGNLTSWAERGVLLLNTSLTVREGMANSHANCGRLGGRLGGWTEFSDKVISLINEVDRPIVYFLWGNNARAKKQFLTNPKHLVLEACHPSPLSAVAGKFFECKHFSKANSFLQKNGVAPIDWRL